MTSSARLGPTPMKATYVAPNLGMSTNNTPSATETVPRYFERTDDNFHRHSLKEKVLLRKFDNTRRSLTRWNHRAESLNGTKDLFNNSDSIRRKLSENRRQLQDLLSRVPSPVVKSQTPEKDSKDAPKSPIHDDHVTVRAAIRSEKSRSLHHSLNSDDSSSSDEDLREPTAESPPNLSDEDCGFPPTREFKRALPPTSYTQKCIVSIARTSSRANMLTHRKASNGSPPNPLYEAAKPKPPPRGVHPRRAATENALKPDDDVSDTVTSDEQAQEIITLPYVSRGTSGNWRSADISRLRHSSRSHSVTESNDVTDVEGDKPAAKSGQSKSDTSPSRLTQSSSGYSSPGSNTGTTTSLSASSSSASSTSSRSLALPKSRLEHAKPDSSGRASAPLEAACEQIPTTLEETKEENDGVTEDVTSSLQGDEDVFPVATWTESSEYSELTKSKEDTKPTPTVTSKTTDDVIEVTSRDYPRLSSIEEDTRARSQTLRPGNTISMVEPRSQTLNFRHLNKPASSSSVKMRIPGVGRSKKAQAASRNSLAFARQASSALDAVREPEPEKQRPTNKSPVQEKDVRRAASLSPKAFLPQSSYITESELSASMANLDKIGATSGGAAAAPRTFNTVSGATGRHLAEKSHFFDDESSMNVNNNNSGAAGHYSSSRSVYTDSTWSLNPTPDSAPYQQPTRKPSLRNRLKGAFSFQNIRRAISTDKLDEQESYSQRSASNCYLNEYDEQLPTPKPRKKAPGDSAGLYKAPSITSIFSTVRMRKRKSRERRERMRNTIAVVNNGEEYDPVNEKQRPNSVHGVSQSRQESVGTPGHFRPIGKVLQMDAREGTLLIEMIKPPSVPYSFYLARRKGSGDRGSVFISSLSDSYPDKMYAGLMKLGDEITEINGKLVRDLPLSHVYDVMLETDRILLRIKPSQVHAV